MPNDIHIEHRVHYPLPETLSIPPRYIRKYLDRFMPAMPAKPRKGDKVSITITGYVDRVDGDVLHLAEHRSAFPGEVAPFGFVVNDGDANTTVRVVERTPNVKVGDEISGRLLKDTPWKRGTLVAVATDRDSKYVLRADGLWISVNHSQTVTFGMFNDHGRYVVEHAPGKDAR